MLYNRRGFVAHAHYVRRVKNPYTAAGSSKVFSDVVFTTDENDFHIRA
jgi:hypothetical protein